MVVVMVVNSIEFSFTCTVLYPSNQLKSKKEYTDEQEVAAFPDSTKSPDFSCSHHEQQKIELC